VECFKKAVNIYNSHHSTWSLLTPIDEMSSVRDKERICRYLHDFFNKEIHWRAKSKYKKGKKINSKVMKEYISYIDLICKVFNSIKIYEMDDGEYKEVERTDFLKNPFLEFNIGESLTKKDCKIILEKMRILK